MLKVDRKKKSELQQRETRKPSIIDNLRLESVRFHFVTLLAWACCVKK